MSEVEQLKQENESLKKIISLQEDIIRLLKQGSQQQIGLLPQPFITIPFVMDICPDGQPHDYPNPWFGITPAPCKRCGKIAQINTVTCNTLSLVGES